MSEEGDTPQDAGETGNGKFSNRENFSGMRPAVRWGSSASARAGQLELSVDRIEKDTTDIRVTLAQIEAKLDSKVDYKGLTICVLGIVAAVLLFCVTR